MTEAESAASSVARSSAAAAWRRATRSRTSVDCSRTRRPAVLTELRVALTTPATVAPVSSSTAARKRKTARMWAPRAPTSEEAAQ